MKTKRQSKKHLLLLFRAVFLACVCALTLQGCIRRDAPLTGDDTGTADSSGEDITVITLPSGREPVSLRSKEEILSALNGMPEGYTLTEEERAIKEDLSTRYSEHMLTAGSLGNHAENEVICLVETEEHATTVANAYSGTLKSYAYGVATIVLDPSVISVPEAVYIGADLLNNLPPVEPNFISELH